MDKKTSTKLKSKPTQLEFFGKASKSYGGELLKKRKGRCLGGRPLSTKHSIHLVLRSSKATGVWSFRIPKNSKRIKEIIEKFALKYGIRILSIANVGNHLHLHIKIPSRRAYKAFIRATTSAIAMAITGVNRWTKEKSSGRTANSISNSPSITKGTVHTLKSTQSESSQSKSKIKKDSFWDLRPFTRIVQGLKSFLSLEDYILLNQLEGFGVKRSQAKMILKFEGPKWARSFLRTAPT